MIGKVFPKISTRGFYDLKTGKTIRELVVSKKLLTNKEVNSLLS